MTLVPSLMRPRLLAVAAVALLTAACTNDFGQSNGKTGFISASAFSNGSGGFVLSPVGAFYGESDLTVSLPDPETCRIAAYSPTVTGTIGGLLTLDAGERLITTLPTRTDTLLPVSEFGLRIYRFPREGGYPFTPGDTLQLTVPGGLGFPTAVVTVRTAEAFTHLPVGVPGIGQELTITWTPAPQPGSTMIFSLRYQTETGTEQLPNEQVLCAFTDDGSADIQTVFLNGWRTANNDIRQTFAQRVRVREVQLGNDTRVSLLSGFDVPTQIMLPPAP